VFRGLTPLECRRLDAVPYRLTCNPQNEYMSVKTSISTLARRSPERLSKPSSEAPNDALTDYAVILDTISRETSRHLDLLAQNAREGQNVMEAVNFARWIQFSGVCRLLERHSLPDRKYPSLRKQAEDVIQDCSEHLRGGRVAPKYAESDISAINRKLDALLASAARPVDVSISVRSPVALPDDPRRNGSPVTAFTDSLASSDDVRANQMAEENRQATNCA